ncbi:MAG: DUF2628 domain-containing protein [Alphaproteobacteria bacterium]|nr:DUF2628 domain-containing protein [Alphaproteobacteria bacterium]
MRLYTVHHRPNVDERAATTDPDVVFVKEGFCWPALFVPLLWLVYRKQVWGLLAFLAVTAILSAATFVSGLDAITTSLLSVALSLYIAAQANDWRRWRLAADGYALVTVVGANNLRRAEEVYFYDRWQAQPIPGPVVPVVGPAQNFAPLPTRRPPASRLTPFATPFDPA